MIRKMLLAMFFVLLLSLGVQADHPYTASVIEYVDHCTKGVYADMWMAGSSVQALNFMVTLHFSDGHSEYGGYVNIDGPFTLEGYGGDHYLDYVGWPTIEYIQITWQYWGDEAIGAAGFNAAGCL